MRAVAEDTLGPVPSPFEPAGRSRFAPRLPERWKRLPGDFSIVTITRLILAASGLFIVWIVPTEPDRWVPLTYTVLILYTLYAMAVCVVYFSGSGYWKTFHGWGHWVDVAWFTLLITLSSGTNSIFFYGYFFSTLVAGFRWGFVSGMRVTAVSVLLFTTFGYAAAPAPPDFEQGRFLIRPVFLLTLGYMASAQGELGLRQRRRLELLKDIAHVSNPRFGIDRTVGILMDRLCAFYEADACLLVALDPASGKYSVRRCRRGEPGGSALAEAVPPELASRLLRAPANHAVAFCSPGKGRSWRLGEESEPTPWDDLETTTVRDRLEAVAEMLDAESFLSVPLGTANNLLGRLYLSFRARRQFREGDATFLSQAVEQVLPVIENIRLVDRLASGAAEDERRRIARDIHDSVIQPYVGLTIGLAALRQRLAGKGVDVSEEVEGLLDMAHAGVADLRREVLRIRTGGGAGEGLLPVVRRFAGRFSDATGIEVRVEAATDVAVNERVSAEALQMVAEGVSNVRRHTQAGSVTVRLASREGCLHIGIENDNPEGRLPAPFTPRSITERAGALGGSVRVELAASTTAVRVEIPL